MDLAIMIEGQDGLNWPRWMRLASAVEELEFAGLYRSDHFTNAHPPDKDSLDLWVSLTWLAGNTRAIEFGPLVSPVSFRHPVHTARMARDVDDLSGGRLQLGLGAGWQVREHELFGWPLLEVAERFARFEEGLEVVQRLLRGGQSVDFEGRYYQLDGARLVPPPERPVGPPLVIGGNGPRRTLPLAARFADEWNGVYLRPEQFSERNLLLDRLLADLGRARGSVRRSLMVGCVYANTQAGLEQKLASRGKSLGELRHSGVLVGTAEGLIEQLKELDRAGVERVMIQWLDLDDLESLSELARSILPSFPRDTSVRRGI
jgi:F420-dependent oxidoreductase-like protein